MSQRDQLEHLGRGGRPPGIPMDRCRDVLTPRTGVDHRTAKLQDFSRRRGQAWIRSDDQVSIMESIDNLMIELDNETTKVD